MVLYTKIPSLAARFRPIADRTIFSALITEAWTVYQAKLESQRDALSVSAAVTGHLETRYPVDDMAVLARYGLSRQTDEVGVRVYNMATALRDQTVLVKLLRRVTTPTIVNVTACGPRYSRDACRGVRPEKWAAMSQTERDEVIDFQDRREAAQVPEQVEPYFADVVKARTAYRAEYKSTMEWPTAIKVERGAYPTWAEIVERFPVLGAHILSLGEV